MARFSKLIGAIVGMVTPAGLVGILSIFGVGLTSSQAGLVLGALVAVGSAVGVFVAPANAPKPVEEPSMAVREAGLPTFADATSAVLTEE